jgi:hypothetical protein
MAYIGVSPSNGVRRKHTYTATASQTSFSGAGAEGATLSYSDSNYVDVYQNGVKLADEDYTATSGTAIVLIQGASADDIVEIIAFDVFSVADTVSKANGGSFAGNVTMAGTLRIAGKATAPSSPSAGDLWFNSATSTVSEIASTAMAVYNGSRWDQMSNTFIATGGTITTLGAYTYHTFTSSGLFTTTAVGTVDYLVVAGGGGAGNYGGGGGAGGFLTAASFTVGSGISTVTVGAGGIGVSARSGTNGSDSVFSSITATGGGGGGGNDPANSAAHSGLDGGSGGGASNQNATGAVGDGISGQGFAGGLATGSAGSNQSGGGGGASAVGVAGSGTGNGGAGLGVIMGESLADSTTILASVSAGVVSGSYRYLAGGGGGGGSAQTGSAGGIGGGGGYGVAGTVNSGGGGGSGNGNTNSLRNGGSGIVIVRYLT